MGRWVAWTSAAEECDKLLAMQHKRLMMPLICNIARRFHASCAAAKKHAMQTWWTIAQ